MELATEGDLLKKIVEHQKKGTCFTEKEVWKAAFQLSKGLKTLHDLKIVHRDLKCANIFISTNASYKLGDLNGTQSILTFSLKSREKGPRLHSNRYFSKFKPKAPPTTPAQKFGGTSLTTKAAIFGPWAAFCTRWPPSNRPSGPRTWRASIKKFKREFSKKSLSATQMTCTI